MPITLLGMFKGFREFIMQGNVVDLATAVVIGAAFAGVINALVENVLMPLISALVGSPDFDSFAVLELNGNALRFGVLLTQVVNFLLIAGAIYFVVIVPMNKMVAARNKILGIDPEPEPLEPDVQLLTEIRDLLASRPDLAASAAVAHETSGHPDPGETPDRGTDDRPAL